MTRAVKPVRRETAASLQGRPIVVSIEPPSLIGLRLKGTRKTEYLPAEAAYWIAVKLRVADEKRQKATQVAMIGNSVPPLLAKAVVAANCEDALGEVAA